MVGTSIALCSFGIGTFAVSQLVEDGEASLRRTSIELATLAARQSHFSLYTHDARDMSTLFESLGTNRDVAYVRLLDADYEIVAERQLALEVDVPKLGADGQRHAEETSTRVLTPESGGRIFEVVAPVIAEREDATALFPELSGEQRPALLGYVQMGARYERLEVRQRSVVASTVAVASGIGVIALLSALLVVRRFTRPLLGLAVASGSIADGDFDQVIHRVTSDDEVGQLSVAFDRMILKLREYRARDAAHRQELEQKVSERTRDLEEKTQEAQAANRAKSQFLANMSHEIRTPMNGVLGMTELLLGTEMSTKQRKFARAIHSSGETLLHVINDILDYSRAEAGKLSIEVGDSDVREIAEEVVTLLAESAHRKNLELACFAAEEVPSVLECDGSRLRQVVMNLVGNAVKFTETGEVVLEMRSVPAAECPEDSQGRPMWLHVEVTDTGIGITEEARERVFSAFHQADGSMARRYGGTGLGLAICRQLVELMGGALHYEPRPVGSRFWFRVPVSPSQSEGQARAERGLTGAKVLLVDDNATNRRILCHHLNLWGCQIGSCEDAAQALVELRSAVECGAPYDVAVLDMMMPDVTGLDLARAIRRERSFDSLGMLFLTSLGLSLSADEMKNLSISRHITKPVRRSDLYRAIAATLGVNLELPKSQEDSPKISLLALGGRTRRILVAEDTTVNQEVAVGILEDLGCATEIAANGLEALRAIEAERPDLVLMDCQMPELDGYAATREIRARELQAGLDRLPIVALTAHAMEGDRDKCLEAGMDDYLTKPFSRDQLAAVLERWLCGEVAEEVSAPARTPDAEKRDVVIDSGVIDMLRSLGDGGESSVLSRVLRAYFESSVQHVAALRDALGGGHLDAARKAAHALKSDSAQVGAMRLSELCREIEARCARSESEDLAAMPSELEDELEAVLEALADECPRE
jgi:signal transduction histidine kinase/CheY-like chemotaxis protein/HPt (histidine-containing phosphotransfer) domain-containing protein